VGLDGVLELLSAADAELLFDAVDAVAAEDARGVLGAIDRLVRAGHDPVQFTRDLLTHLRHLLVIRTTGEVPQSFSITSVDEDRMQAQAATVGDAQLVRAIDELAASLTAIREGDDARLAIELALLKAARPDLDPSTEGLARRIERLERSVNDRRSTVVGEGGDSGEPQGPPTGPAPAEVASEEPEASEARPSPQATAVATEEPIDLERVLRLWPAVVDQVRQSGSAMLSALFEGARPVGLDSEEAILRIGFPSSASFNKRKAEAAEHRERFAEALRTIVGERLRPVYVLLDGESQPQEEKSELDEQEILERIKSEFDAEEVG
jgi:DNA polymerase-3 subunit gamma/tau